MAEEDLVPIYRIPVETYDGVREPVYDLPSDAEIIWEKYGTRAYQVVLASKVPHFHAENVDVSIAEVNKQEFMDD